MEEIMKYLYLKTREETKKILCERNNYALKNIIIGNVRVERVVNQCHTL